MTITRRAFAAALPGATLLRAVWAQQPEQPDLKLPNHPDSLRFAVIGDSGTGGNGQRQVADVMARYHAVFPFSFVLMLGDNLYGRERPADYVKKFETPYKTLLDAGVKFYASLGNHDEVDQRFYKNFNMNGERYYTFQPRSGVRFFAIDSNYMNPAQFQWLEKELSASGSDWKIVFCHHPIYSSGKHGPSLALRKAIEPLFVKYGVNVMFSGHEHFYERIKPQNGIHHFISGAAGKLRDSDIRRTGLTAAGFDRDLSFMLLELSKDMLHYQAVSRRSITVDSGVITRSAWAPASPRPSDARDHVRLEEIAFEVTLPRPLA